MITMWDVYWITRLDAIVGLSVAVALVSVFAIFLLAMIGDTAQDELFYYKKWIVSLAITLILSVASACMVPSTKEVVAIYMIPKVANNEQVQKLPDNAMKFINGKLEEWIADMGKKKK